LRKTPSFMKQRQLNILIIDDDAVDARSVDRYLRKATSCRFNPTIASSGAAGVRLLKSARFDVALLDFHLPGETTESVLSALLTEAVPVVVVTGWASAEQARPLIQAGAQDYIQKSALNPALLERVILYTLDRHHLIQDLKQANADLRTEVTQRKRAERALEENAMTLAAANEALVEAKRGLESAVAQLSQAKSELNQKKRELESAIYVASHDLWSPLVNIKGFSVELNEACNTVCSVIKEAQLSDDLKKELETVVDAKILRALDFIVAGVTKMDTLLDGLLRLSRLGRESLQLEQLDMNAMLASIANASAFQIRESEATLEIETLPPCFGDATQINQVFSNLLDNALKYLDPSRSGVIRIHGEQKDGRAVYCVEDNGIGIAPEDHDRIFEIFCRLDPEDTVGGEGLGLAVVRRILGRQGGKVWLESEPGQGSRFFVSLPARAE
jgi:signal transduction histidine kinase